ncbi:hybrid sensor histidine kinase/response regulator [Ectopseudomonas alcaliphila]|uniref:hybrid sensor histidine kinase/response regulator n=1 Tax=Ectopseudomonas alcaliphila TaxID=101564 RepID=UPI002784D454|nr:MULTISPECIES: hybrid sensor histidine kinase/response regulator [Pseudomonas]MDP9941950.1 two-component system sensor histidine kinase and response regulator WspE [Pseudomonas sp. 3400]MDR7014762.1 two-component system sensor histidine kinase and response regulator WspE [Pseudomonas alcaliphila]
MTPDQMRDASLLDLFRLEAEAQKQVLDTGLLILERDPTNASQLEACMRAAHSLKGAARIVGLDNGVQVAHAMEDLLVAAQEGLLRLLPDHIDALLQGSDLLLRIGQAQQDAEQEARVATVTTRLQVLLGNAVPALRVQPGESAAFAAEVAPPNLPEAPTATSPQSAEPVADERISRVLRVSAERFDHLIDLSGKSLVEFQRTKPLNDSLHRLKRQQESARRTLETLREHLLGTDLDASAQALFAESRNLLIECQQQLQAHQELFDDFVWYGGQRTQQLYDLALASRMRPFADVLTGQTRMLRDLGRSLGKQVRLEIEGENTQVDRDVLERLEAPLTHLLRNAVDHGIEPPALRARKGKPEEGVVQLRARHHAGMLVLEVGDDGAGIDLERVAQAVIKRRFATAEQVQQMTEEELLAFLFLPGFSMSQQVTEVSGRGVGLDVVQHEIRRMRGNVRLLQSPDQGCLFHLELPLTLSVVRALVVTIGGEAYAFPLAQIERMLRLPRSAIVQLEGRQHFWLEDEHVGLISAAQLLQCNEKQGDDDSIPIVLIRDREQYHGLAVEAFLGEFTLVLMPLDGRLGKVRDVAAGALLHDGTPVLILDVDDLLNSVGKLLGTGHLERVDHASHARQAVSKRVLVVDDSLTVRELERKLLLSRGYQVSVAVDGMDGWNALRAEAFDLLITDIDMPRMDGIELVTQVRQDPRLRSLPVMVVSYKDREEDRRRGLEAGADYYLAKASFHDEALLDAVQTLIGEARE